MAKYRILESRSFQPPLPLIVEPRMVDYNFDVHQEEFKDEVSEYTTTEYVYTTYRFENFTEYQNWVNEEKDKEIATLKEENELLTGCVMDIAGMISDIMEAE